MIWPTDKKGCSPRVVSHKESLLQVADILEGEDGSSHLVFRSSNRVSDQQVY